MLTDVVMPQMSGPDLAEHVMSLRPGMKVIYMSGYTDSVIADHGVVGANLEYLQKPFGPDVLASRIRAVLDRPADA